MARHAFKRRHRSFILTQRTQGKTPPPRRGKELLGRGMSDPSLESAGSDYRLVGPIASRTSPLHSVALRVMNTSTKKSYSKTSLPVDNPHRGSGDWLGVWFNIIWLLGFGWVWIIKTSGCVILMLRDDAVDEHRTNDNRKCSPKWKTRPMADSPSYQRRN